MERTLEIRTGESIGIRYELAGLGSRFLAVGVDFAIQVGITLAIVLLLLLLSFPLASATGSIVIGRGATKSAQAILGAIGIFAVFLIFFGYFMIFELWWSGRTPGKRALGIRVVRDAGFPIDPGAAVIRNLIRVLEFGFGFYALSALSALVSRQNKRLGDLAAGTIVVRDRRDDASTLATYLGREAPADDGLSSAERDLVERYVTRRAMLEPAARTRLAAQIAERLRPKLRASFDHLSDDELLGHLGRAKVDRALTR